MFAKNSTVEGCLEKEERQHSGPHKKHIDPDSWLATKEFSAIRWFRKQRNN